MARQPAPVLTRTGTLGARRSGAGGKKPHSVAFPPGAIPCPDCPQTFASMAQLRCHGIADHACATKAPPFSSQWVHPDSALAEGGRTVRMDPQRSQLATRYYDRYA